MHGIVLISIGILLICTFLILYFLDISKSWWNWIILGIGVMLIITEVIILMINSKPNKSSSLHNISVDYSFGCGDFHRDYKF